ncbi:hypothetical protein C483_09624 [Natrialba hulunbeirensis JCM 10989]|uniref:Uncharacterized protein n=1 Tax=Natrialba hulunbeirensis JCM 10989 TaxID=1227493 RepID=M0A359_9EURY|nr:hypothetical protein C483_09624 [Natrialba hulunbeirensis JCM 10989]
MGVGAIIAGGGAALGTGAFSSVEASRQVSIETTGDSSALLAIEIRDDYATDSDTAEIALTDEALESDGLNLDAETTFEGMTALSNQGSETVQLGGVSQELGDEIELWFEPQTEPQASLGDDHFEGTVTDSNIADGEFADPHYRHPARRRSTTSSLRPRRRRRRSARSNAQCDVVRLASNVLLFEEKPR